MRKLSFSMIVLGLVGLWTSRKRSTDKISIGEKEIDRVPLSADPISLEEVKEIEKGQQVTYYDTENSPFAKEGVKVLPRGIDSF
jgi:hypothetical protein